MKRYLVGILVVLLLSSCGGGGTLRPEVKTWPTEKEVISLVKAWAAREMGMTYEFAGTGSAAILEASAIRTREKVWPHWGVWLIVITDVFADETECDMFTYYESTGKVVLQQSSYTRTHNPKWRAK